MQGKLITIRADGRVIEKELTSPPTLKDLQTGVGGYIETVPYLEKYEGKPCVAFCNEEGKLRDLPINPAATAAWYLSVGSFLTDVLCGDVVVIVGDDELLESL